MRPTATAALLAAALLAAPPAAAAEPLTLAELAARVLATHPSLAEARSDAAAAEAGVDEAAAERGPRAGLRGTASLLDEPAPVTPIHGFGADLFPDFSDDLVQAELSLSYDLYRGGALPALADRAAARRAAAGWRLGEARASLLAAAVAGYARVRSLAAVVTAHDRRLAALGEERSRVEQLYAVGRAAEVDRRRVAAATAGAEAERVRLASGLDLAERDLARLAAWPVEAVRAERLAALPAVAIEAAPDRQTLAAAALASSPRLAAAHAELAAAEVAVRLAASERRPRLGVRGAFVEYGTAEGFDAGEWQAAVEVTVPLWDAGRVAAREARARAERDAAAARLDAGRDAVLAELDAAFADVERSRAQRAAFAEAVERWREVVRVEALRLEQGVGIQADYLDAEAELVAAEASLAEVRFAELAARAELARAVGRFRGVGLGLDDLVAVDTEAVEE